MIFPRRRRDLTVGAECIVLLCGSVGTPLDHLPVKEEKRGRLDWISKGEESEFDLLYCILIIGMENNRIAVSDASSPCVFISAKCLHILMFFSLLLLLLYKAL